MIDWHTDLQDAIVRDYIGKERFAELCASKGIANDTTVVFYGDKSNWWACYAFWVFKLFGHEKCLIMDGGRKRWEPTAASGRAIRSRNIRARSTRAKDPDLSIRAFRDEVLKHTARGKPLVDVRSPGEYVGDLLAMPDYPQEGALRGGHIPGAGEHSLVARPPTTMARSNPPRNWKNCTARKTIFPAAAATIAYCRIGERSSHTWFVLRYLLGFGNVKNYDGSWTEWGNMVGMPIQRGPEVGTAQPQKAAQPSAAS